MKYITSILLLIVLNFGIKAQEGDSLSLEEEFAPSISLNPSGQTEKSKKAKKDKEEKPPKGVFYGIPARKIILKEKKGRNIITEKFHILKSYEHPSVYVRDRYYFDPTGKSGNRKIQRIIGIGEKYGLPLHGPYEKRVNGELREKGIYYMGTKHGRWVTYATDLRLLDKVKFNKGFAKGSRVSYYEGSKTKIKEVIPIEDGRKEGMYYEFYPNGRIKVEGAYREGEKVGQWHEFYDTHMKLRQRITQYPEDPEDDTEPYIFKEWNSRGKTIIDNSNK